MRERYIQMRNTSQFDLNWFYEYYVQEFPNIPQTWFKNGQTIQRELIPANQFMNPFQMMFSLQSIEVLDYLDKVYGVTKVEDKEGKLIHIS